MARVKFTVFGASGFIGSHLVRYLSSMGHEVQIPDRQMADLTGRQLGHVIYAIGLTGDFRTRPYDTVEAHVFLLSQLLQHCKFSSFLYLSTTRIYANAGAELPTSEESPIWVTSSADALYDLSKLLGESLCLGLPNANVRVARLANVFGKGMNRSTFLGSILEVIKKGSQLTIHESRNSCKDYVSIEDVVQIIELIAIRGESRLYNIASGAVTTHAALLDKLCEIAGVDARYSSEAPTRRFPAIDISRSEAEFQFKPKKLIDNLHSLIDDTCK
jgi:nucleoside-diphosphate-sugar epimerase